MALRSINAQSLMARTVMVAFATCLAQVSVHAQRPLLPGTGTELTSVGDDFEDPTWGYVPNDPKSTEDIDTLQRAPLGRSTNGRWFEGAKRGHPDIVRRVETPPGGLPAAQEPCC